MDHVQFETAQNVALDAGVAGLGDRVIAALLDYLTLAAYAVGVFSFLGALGVSVSRLQIMVVLTPVFVYFLACEILLDGQSLGKRYVGVRVTRIDGSAPTVGNYVVRWLLRPVDVTLTSGLGAVLSILLSGTGQRLGDLAAGTTVVRIARRTRLQDTLYADVAPNYEPVFPEARALSDEHAATIKEVLNVLDDGTPSPDLAERTKATVERKLGIRSDLSPYRFLETVLRDYTAVYGSEKRD